MSRYARELDLRELNAHTQGILLTPPGSDVLDVGTADGHPVVAGLTARGCRVWGVEIDEEAAAEAAPMCESMVVGNVEQLDLAEAFGDKRFDVVLCLDVLEHLVEPLDTLRRLKDLLSPSGILVASIPNVTHAAVRLQLLGGAFTYTDTGLLDRTHVRFFDRTEVTALFDDAGLTVLERLEVRREPHETEIPIDLDAVPAETLAQVTADPDARVFQWMLVAKRHVDGAEVDTTGLPTALLGEVTRLERAGRESAEHVGWLEQQLRSRPPRANGWRAGPHPARARRRAGRGARGAAGCTCGPRGEGRLRPAPAGVAGIAGGLPARGAARRGRRARTPPSTR
jgi:2-polyprenyl-3-methyl-5-hydroxy-6-metoxy-1,4-benzoquinol methylase